MRRQRSHAPFYGTSQLYATRGDSMANADLEGARFLDMPWMVQPDPPAVMIYPRPSGVGNSRSGSTRSASTPVA
ncbi:MAG: hypothetical protein U1E63_01990 [Burkholderiales bacterium]